MTTESERHANPNPNPYLVAVQYGGLASSYRKFTFAISSADEFLVFDTCNTKLFSQLRQNMSIVNEFTSL